MRGFSLIELLVALAVGLIVMGAVLALIMSIIRANNQTIQTTRLTQELRATAAVITADLKRARGVDDPLAAARQGNPFANIVLDGVVNPPSGTVGQCISYGYANASGGGFHVIRLNGGKVSLAEANTAAAATCALAGQQLNSPQVTINALSFTIEGRQITVTLTGSLQSGDPDVAAIRRSLSQTVFVRSVGS
jgi:prepilin-type N-terminal cleavage/methylation domain-containing protein